MLFQASGVAIGDRCVLVTGKPGCGKSSLALALIDRGGVLVGDDGVALDRQEDMLIASPPPTIAGMLEVRGVGLVELPTVSAPVALLVAVGEDGERLPERLPTTAIEGIAIPTLHLASLDWSAPLRIEQALAAHGLGAATQVRAQP